MEVKFELDTPLGPEWGNAESLRIAIVSCLAALFKDRDFGQSVGIVSSELVENAIKYGDWDNPDRSLFRFRLSLKNDEIVIKVSNPVSTAESSSKELLETVKWIKQFPTPAEAYMTRMREIADQPKGSKASSLGLVRIAYEGNFELDAQRDENSVIHLTATSKIVHK
jgi:hypothetical protein